MVGPMTQKLVWISITLFPVFVSITQFSDFWVMSYGNWKHILSIFSFHNFVFNGIFVITPYMHGPTVRATHVSAAFDASSTALFSTNIFIFLSSFSGLRCIVLSFFLLLSLIFFFTRFGEFGFFLFFWFFIIEPIKWCRCWRSSQVRSSFFFFRLSHLRSIKKKNK